MGEADDAYKQELIESDIDFSDCAITCEEGTVDTSTCSCSSCSASAGCCQDTTVGTVAAAYSNHNYLSLLFAYLLCFYIFKDLLD